MYSGTLTTGVLVELKASADKPQHFRDAGLAVQRQYGASRELIPEPLLQSNRIDLLGAAAVVPGDDGSSRPAAPCGGSRLPPAQRRPPRRSAAAHRLRHARHRGAADDSELDESLALISVPPSGREPSLQVFQGLHPVPLFAGCRARRRLRHRGARSMPTTASRAISRAQPGAAGDQPRRVRGWSTRTVGIGSAIRSASRAAAAPTASAGVIDDGDTGLQQVLGRREVAEADQRDVGADHGRAGRARRGRQRVSALNTAVGTSE